MDKSQTEVVLRIAITGLEQAEARVMSIPHKGGDANICSALAGITKAQRSIRLWAEKNRFEITESMKT